MVDFRINVIADPRGARTGLRAVRGELGDTLSASELLGRSLRNALAGIGGALAIGQITRTLAGYEQQISTVRAVTGATETQFAALRAETQRLGASTRFSASQAAEGATFLARAGFDVQQVLGSLNDTLLLAQAGGLDLGRAADIASNALTGFRLPVEQAGRVVDVLALAANSANTDVGQLGEGLKFVAPVAAGLRVPIEEVVAAIGSLSDAGLQGSLAGTGLRRVLAELESPAAKTEAILARAGVSIDEVRVSTNGLTPALLRLRDAGIDTGLALEIFGDRGGPAFEVLSANIPRVEELTAALGDAGGTAERIAGIMDDNLNGALLSVASAFEGLILAFGETGATDLLTGSLATLAGTLRILTDNIDTLAILVQGGLVAGLVRLTAAAGGASIATAAYAVATSGAIGRSLAFGLAINRITASLGALRVALLSNPITAIAVGATAALAALSLIPTQQEEIAELNGLISETAEDIQDAYREVGDSVEAVRERLADTSTTQAVLNQVTATEALSDANQTLASTIRILSDFGSEAEQEIARLALALDSGGISADRFRTVLGQIAQANPAIAETAREVENAADQVDEAAEAARRADLVLVALTGTTDEAAAAIRELSGAGEAAVETLDNISRSANGSAEAIQGLAKFIPELANAAKVQARLEEARLIFETGLASTNRELNEGIITLDEAAERNARLANSFTRATEEIDGTVDRLNDAGDALNEYARGAELGALSARQAALARENETYQDLLLSLREAGVAQELLGDAQSSYQARIAQINRRFDEQEARRRSRGGSSRGEADRDAILARELRGLEQEAQLLGVVGDERTALARILQVEDAIRGDLRQSNNELSEEELDNLSRLTDAEQLRITSLIQSNEALRAQTTLLEELTGGQDELADRLVLLNELYASGEIGIGLYTTRIREAQQAQRDFRIEIGESTFADGFLSELERMTDGVSNFETESGRLFGQVFSTISDGFANSIGQAIFDTDSLGESLKRVARDAISQLVSGFVRLGTQIIVNQALGQAASTGATATSVAEAGVVASAWAPAAALSSLATLGSNSGPAILAIGAAVAAAAGLAFAGAFADGGQVRGPGGPRGDRLLAALSDGEFVVNAAAARRNLPLLERINNGQRVSMGGGGVTVVQNIRTPDENSFRRAQRGVLRRQARALQHETERN